MSSFSLTLQPLLNFFSADPMMRAVQGGLLLAGSLVIFMLFYATRDIILRTRSFLYQFACILTVATLPVVGFLLYLLIRPARTVKERQTEAMLKAITAQLSDMKEKPSRPQQHHHHQQKQDKEKRNFIARQAAAKAVAMSKEKDKAPLKPVEVETHS